VDPALTALVLRMCNSAFYGGSSPVLDLRDAVARLGFTTISRIVAAASAGRALGRSQRGYGLDEGELWQHSITTAVAAQVIARAHHLDESLAFTAGLLHDLGKIVLSASLEQRYDDLITDVEEHQQALAEAEQHLLGVNHAQVGGRLLDRWKFPAPLVSAVWFHHQPEGAGPHGQLAACVYLANMTAYFLGHGYGRSAFAFRGREDALTLLTVDPDELPHFMIQTHARFAEIEALFTLRL
jgi:putative nucleotidyltransferase with HDIG domain